MSPLEQLTALRTRYAADGLNMGDRGFVIDLLPDVRWIDNLWGPTDIEQVWQLLEALDNYDQRFKGPCRTVPMASIVSINQETFLFPALTHYLTNQPDLYGSGKFHESGMPVALDNGHGLVLIDGTHRYLAAYMRGDASFDVCVVPLHINA